MMLIFCCSLCVSNIKNTQSRKFLETIQICLKLHPNKRNINITESSQLIELHATVIRAVPLAPRGPRRKAVHEEGSGDSCRWLGFLEDSSPVPGAGLGV